MATYRGKPVDVLNRAIKIYFPETTNNTYADYPMVYGSWCNPGVDHKIPYGSMKGEPCFIKTGGAMSEMKNGYVWGPGKLGFGYYHLLTSSAHQILYARVQTGKVKVSNEDGGCCPCFNPPDPRTIPPKPTDGLTSDDIDDIRVLFHARSTSTVPNDNAAKSEQIQGSRNTAQGMFIMEQGFAAQDVVTVSQGINNQTIKR